MATSSLRFIGDDMVLTFWTMLAAIAFLFAKALAYDARGHNRRPDDDA